jgi:hypothetical protein
MNVGIGVIFLPGNWRESIMIRGRDGTSRAAALKWKGPDEVGGFSMKMVIRLSRKEELKALPILLRHSPGMMLRNRLFVLSEEAVKVLHGQRIRFSVVAKERIS